MALKFSTELRRQMLVVGSLKNILDGGVIRIYSGPVPADADSALAGATLLVEVDASGELMTFEDTAPGGTLTKNLDQVWQSDITESGTATFFRYVKPSDTGTMTTGEVRIQGTAGGPASDMTLTSPVLTAGNPHRIEYFGLSIPITG